MNEEEKLGDFYIDTNEATKDIIYHRQSNGSYLTINTGNTVLVFNAYFIRKMVGIGRLIPYRPVVIMQLDLPPADYGKLSSDYDPELVKCMDNYVIKLEDVDIWEQKGNLLLTDVAVFKAVYLDSIIDNFPTVT